MLCIQHDLNKKIMGEDYINSNIPFYRAAIVESTELMDHRGYKWWKKQEEFTPERLQQAQLEIVDIWHFLMSHLIVDKYDTDSDCVISEECFDLLEHCVTDSSSIEQTQESQLRTIDNFISSLTSEPILEHHFMSYCVDFSNMMAAFDLSFDELYEMYIGKNALNYFRQNNGYKEGTYNKNGWINNQGEQVEDNVVLGEILNSDWETFSDVYDKLVLNYSNISK